MKGKDGKACLSAERSRQKLNEQYLKPQAMNAVSKVLPECLRTNQQIL